MRSSPGTAAARVASALEAATGRPLLFGIRFWDGSAAGPERAPVAVVASPRVVRRQLFRPGRLSLARSFVAGELEVEGDLVDLLHRAVPMGLAARPLAQRHRPLSAAAGALGLLAFALRSGALGGPPVRPRAEIRGRLRRGAAVRHHYDAGNAFYEIVLGPSMVYSCAYWPDRTSHPPDLDRAQHEKLELICRKLCLRPGMRLLDIGCGWGSLLVHAGRQYGVRGVGVTLSGEQAAYARERVSRAGLDHLVEVRLCDYRDVADGPYDAVSSVEVTQHLGRRELPAYAERLHRLLAPGGRLLAHDVYMTPEGMPWQQEPALRRYLFPELNIRSLGESVACLEAAGMEVLDVENLRHHFALTFRAWLVRLEEGWDRAVAEVGPERARAWRLYLAGAAMAWERNWGGAAHTVAVRPAE